jgi:hypothetical protein
MALLVVGVLALVRLGEAIAGHIPAARAAGELGLIAALGVVGAAAAAVLAGASRRTVALVGVTLAAWGAVGVMPLWRIAHPRASLYEGELGGAAREITTAPAPADGRFVIDASSCVRASGRGAFLLRAIAGSVERTLAGDADTPAHPVELLLARGRTLRIFVETSDGHVNVRVRPLTLPHGWMQLLALLVALLALGVDALALIDRPRWQGAFAAAVAASLAYAALLDPELPPSGATAIALALLAVMAGGLVGGLAAIGALVRARRRRAARAR